MKSVWPSNQVFMIDINGICVLELCVPDHLDDLRAKLTEAMKESSQARDIE